MINEIEIYEHAPEGLVLREKITDGDSLYYFSTSDVKQKYPGYKISAVSIIASSVLFYIKKDGI